VSFDNNVLSRGVKSSLQAMHIVYENVGRFEDIRPTIRDTQMLAQRRLRAP
jgi:phosphoheptose isomerase